MSNLFNASQKTRYYLNFSINNDDEKENKLDSINGMYRIECTIVIPKLKVMGNTAVSVKKPIKDKHYISFYVDQENLPNFSFDTNIEDGFKTILLNSIEQSLNESKIMKFSKISPDSYYTPLADNNTRKIYQNGTFNNINLKFRAYDEHYMGVTTNEKITPPLEIFAYLSSCIFPRESGGSVEEYLRSMVSGITHLAFGKAEGQSVIQTFTENLIHRIAGTSNGEDETKFYTQLKESLKQRVFGCPTVVINRLGDRKIDVYKEIEFFVTNFNATFSKDMILNPNNQLSPIYIDFEITLSPTLIPSFDTMSRWLFNNTITEDLAKNLDKKVKKEDVTKYNDDHKLDNNTLRTIIKIGK